MAFGSILDLFKKDNWGQDVVDKIGKMLELAESMFTYAGGVVVFGQADANPQGQLYERDQRINKLERKIRRRVVSHLSVQGAAADVPSALIFMNVVKDAERLGDYIKNMHEVQEMMPDAVDRELYLHWLKDPTEVVGELFVETREAFALSDEATAGLVIKTAKDQGRECERLIREITVGEVTTVDAVCLVLILRFYKRLVAHMSNIASTVVMPVDMIDFYDEPEG